jgi:hypothetical protein
MNKAAGLLSMDPFPVSEDHFLNQLASMYWKEEDLPLVVEAWKFFREGYENYPLTNLFQYYGPMHDGPVWPLLLKPADAPLSPTWQIGSSTTLQPWPPSGDRVGECIGGVLTLEEVVSLARRITASWDKGVNILIALEKKYSKEPERIKDIGVARALGIQFRSGYNILNFYLLREKMFRLDGRERLEILKKLKGIIEEELELDKQLLELCIKDTRLGFHSEAEGYKYFPEKINWRMGELRKVLKNDVPALKKIIRNNELLFPEYTGKRPMGTVAYCPNREDFVWTDKDFDIPCGLQWQQLVYGIENLKLQWAVHRDLEALYFWLKDQSSSGKNDDSLSEITSVQLKIEPRRLFPAMHFYFSRENINIDGDPVRNLGYSLMYTAGLKEFNIQGKSYLVVRIPLRIIELDAGNLHPIRLDVGVQNKEGGFCSWRPNNPITPRLILGSDNPADLGWLVFKN